MTINEHDRITAGRDADTRSAATHGAHALVDLLNAGEPYAVAFGGQGGNWLENLEELISSAGIESELSEVVGEAALLLEPVARELVVVRPVGFEPMQWVRALAAEEPLPTAKQLTTAAISGPGILLAQMAAIRAVSRQGLDLQGTPPVAMAGHSQGIVAVESLKAAGARDAELLALLQLIGAAGSLVSRRRGMVGRGDKSPMVSVTNAEPDRIAELLEDFSKDVRTVLPPVLSIRNGRRSVVITGTPEQLARFELYCSKITEKEEAERKNKTRGGAVFAPVFNGIQVEVGFHTPRLADGVEVVDRWAARTGIDPELAHHFTESIFVKPIDWVAEVERLHDAGAKWIIDLGPSDTLTRLTAPVIRGLGVGIVPAATRAGQRNLFTVGAAPEVPPAWSSYAPSTVTLPDGSVKLSTKFTRLTGRSPILLAGMTPTTVDAKIVAAAANAGHWAELAGGGQVTEPIFDARIEELTQLLEPGRAIQFNSLFLDPYLWKLQLGGKRLVQRARQSGAPIDGVVVTAGIPELEEAVALIEELNGIGITHVCFKPGTVDQIKSVIKIAAEVPDREIIVHIEGGRAGGHHSWEDLDDLLVSTYGDLRRTPNLTICVGGGIGTPERAAEYLSGRWATEYGFPLMPVDGILVGTAAMATLEATTSPAVKQMLVETTGTDTWVGAGRAQGGMASGRSQLGADIHEIDNAASRCGRLLDEVAGDGDAVAARRDEIIAAMAVTAKPYFGDVAEMTFLEWLNRYVELAIGDGSSTADTKKTGSPWLDVSWRDRFEEMLKRTEARLHPADSGPIPTLFGADAEGEALLEDPQRAIGALLERYPDAATVKLHPADVPFFITLCKTLGKPVNFVPVIDKDVRRWWRSDSLWQAHDARYTADQVCIIPGTQAVAGITRVDEPVGELLDRFEKAAIDDVVAAGGQPVPVVSRRQARADVTGPLAVVLDSPDVLWAGRTAINPVHRIGAPSEWQVNQNRSATHPSTGARLELTGEARQAGAERPGEGAAAVTLSVPLSDIWITIKFTLPTATVDGGMPVVTTEDASEAMRSVLAIAANVEGPEALPRVENDSTTVTVAWDPEEVADHTGVTATFGAPLAPGLTLVPDALVGSCWPAVFSVIGSATTEAGFPVVEGLLSLVHLDHAAHLLAPLPKDKAELTVTATASAATDTEYGRVIPVAVTIADPTGQVVAELHERFAIRGRSGSAELADPPRAGGAITDNATETPRRRRRDVTVTAPTDMSAFAVVSGDHNPIHTDRAAALLAGLKTPIVHGMWLSAAAQHVVTATDGRATPPARLVGWTSRFLGMVLPGDEIDFRVDRVGIDRGAEIIEVSAKVDGELVMAATAQLAAPKTVYAFPGQGIQHKGMGMEVRARSKAARKIWDTADKFTRETLGFSVLHVVRDNPTSLIASGVHYHHPEGVLYLTQFTQVAMATVAAAQVAEMREQGAFVEGAIACGHSVGEYTALACVSGVYQLEALLEVVFHRGSKMHDIVPRDENGRSNYRLAAIRPSQIDLDDDDVTDFVAEISERTGEFLQIVNFNLRGSQYAIAGTVRGLEALEEEIERRREISGGKRSFILVPGIDVPFHSEVLRVGVADFRRSLERVMPRDQDPELIVGRYIPNLVPRPFTLDRDFIQEIRDLVPAEPLDEILADYDTWRNERPSELMRKVVIELLAWQFASPVRWIETQDLLFIEEAAGGLGIERFVEIGVKSAPTVAGLATNTLKLPEYSHSTVEVLNSERDAAVLFATDTDPEPEADDVAAAPSGAAPAAAATPAAAPAAPAAAPAAPAAPAGAPSPHVAPAGAPRPDDIAFDAADATVALIALMAKMRLDQIETLDSIESITDGASSRRNQLLVDLGSELNLGAIDGAAEADLGALKGQVSKLARTYKPFGPVLGDAINDQLRTVFGPSGKRPAYITERVTKTWELGPGWAKNVTVEVALGTREGSSVRGGALGGLHDGALADAGAVDKVIDAAVLAVGARKGVAVSMPSAGGGAGGVVDSAALGEFAEKVTGRDGVLASTARMILNQLGLDQQASVGDTVTDTDLIDLVSSELGSDWPRLVAPSFDGRKAVLFDDRWASAREDLARLWLAEESDIDADWQRLSERFEGAGHVVATQANWWQGKALAAGRNVHAALYGRAAAGAENPAKGRYADEIAVVTGASKGSIAAAVTARLLSGGATVIATTSRLDDKRLAFYKDLYRDNASFGATLWVVPANMASYSDIDALVEWVGNEQSESLGPQSIHLKDALTPTLLFPFAAPRVAGDMSEAGARAEMEMKVLLWAVQRLIAGLSHIGAERDIASRLHVVLPGSPNRGMFGGDGAYGEAKSALDAVVTRWKAETSWSQRVSLAHALIGWTKGTGLMGHNDAIAGAVEEAGVTTYTTDEMAAMLLDLCDIESKVAAARQPLQADLTGGLGEVDIDLAELAAKAREDMAGETRDTDADDVDPGTIRALPSPPRGFTGNPTPTWTDLDVDPADLVVIVGGAELGPYGSSRTRFEVETSGELSAAGVLELAWTTGLVKWEDDPKPGWYDTQTGEMVDEGELVERYHDAVIERVGIREWVDDGAIDPDHAAPLLVSVFLDKDFTFVVSSEEEARAFVQFDPEHTVIAPVPDSGDWQVTRQAGTEIRVPRKVKLSRTVGAQVPTGFDPTVYGVTPDMMNSIDRLALWNLVTTVDAFLSSGFSPAELMRWVHPSLVASTQGTGMGGMTSMQTMYHGNLLGRNKPNDILQEVLPNVFAGHVVQSYVGSYGAMIHPVGACATAAVSVEEGVDKIRLGKAQFVVAGGYDDLTLEAIIGFGDMSATADTEMMRAKGISDAKMSRANDRRRLGFVEGQGGGTILLARGDLALEMGLPVMAVVGYVSSFGDGVHTSIPAPGLGALGAGRGGRKSELARSLAKLGVTPDDIAVISKHDTSTLANDPNETELHERLAKAMGRSEGNPLFVVSQKSLTGHSKGGAAAFQMMGLCQILRDGVIPPNRSLDCVDDELSHASHFVWVREALHLGDKLPLKAGLITSLGFGHVSGLIALVHPQAFLASLDEAQRADYQRRAAERVVAGQRRLASAIAGGPAMYEKPADRRFNHDAPQSEKRQEADMLLDPTSRLGADGWYAR